MKAVLLVSCFGMIGVLSRYFIGLFVLRHFQAALPIATFIINILGSFLIGALYVLGLERELFAPEIRVGLMVGLLGGFTTFSAYCIESIVLLERGELLAAAFYFIGSPFFGFIACYGGITFVRFVTK